jgi:hypothetical protein
LAFLQDLDGNVRTPGLKFKGDAAVLNADYPCCETGSFPSSWLDQGRLAERIGGYSF